MRFATVKARILLRKTWLQYLATRQGYCTQIATIKKDDVAKYPTYYQFSESYQQDDVTYRKSILKDMIVHQNFITPEEEQSIIAEIEPYLQRMRYELDHWDDAIHGFRETERLKWNKDNTKIIDRVRHVAFLNTVEQLKYVHILDLQKDGYIKSHIDAVRFCGDTIAGLSLLTDSIMRLVHDKKKNLIVDILLERRSLYIMKNVARYDYTHEILSNKCSIFNGKTIEKDRRISIICRNAPSKDQT